MTNAIDTCTAVFPTEKELEAYSLNDADSLVIRAFSNLQTAARVYKREGLTQPQMVERLSKLGVKCSTRAIQRVFAELRKDKDAEFKPVGSSRSTQYARKAAAKVQNRQFGGIGQPDEPSSPSISFLFSDTSNNDQSNVEQGDTELFECEVVSDLQSEMGTSYHGCSTRAVSMDTTNNGRADEEYDEVLELIDRIKTISSRHYRPNQPGTWSEHQWLNLTELYCTMHSIAEGYSRDYKQERRDYADQCVKKVGAFFDTTDGSSRNRIGGNA